MSHTSVIYQHSSTNNSLPLRSTRPRRPKPARSQTLSKLKASYSNAARAFLHHRTEEAHALVEEAFELLYPPESSQPDQFSSYRRKWDILRITLETTLYTTPTNGSTKRNEMLKSVAQLHSSSSKLIGSNEWSVPRSPLRPEHRHSSSSPTVDDPLLLSPPSLLGTLHTRSIRLFSPPSDRPGSRCLPAAVLVALVLASLKLDCPQVGRAMIEDWLPSRDSLGVGTDDEERDEEREGYEKVIEVYSLHVLPRLNEWDGAKEFLDSEAEMRPAKRKELVAILASHHAQSLLPPSPRHSQLHNLDTSVSGSSGAPTPRAASPAPSSVSSHTAVPHSRPATTAPLSPTTPRQFHHSTNVIPTPPSLATTTIAIPPPAPPLTIQPSSPQHPTIIQLLKAVLMPYLRKLNAPVVLLAIVLSFLGLISRFGRRTKSPGSGAEVARRRLMGGSGVWRGLMDAVKMSGRGLV